MLLQGRGVVRVSTQYLPVSPSESSPILERRWTVARRIHLAYFILFDKKLTLRSKLSRMKMSFTRLPIALDFSKFPKCESKTEKDV